MIRFRLLDRFAAMSLDRGLSLDDMANDCGIEKRLIIAWMNYDGAPTYWQRDAMTAYIAKIGL